MKELFHTSGNVDFLKSFMNEGIKTIGKGAGGQSDGFYVWEDKESALFHASYKSCSNGGVKEGGLENNQGLIIGVKVPKENFKYPFWQFDYEQAPDLIPLITKYWKEASEVMKSDFKTGHIVIRDAFGVYGKPGVFFISSTVGKLPICHEISLQNCGNFETGIFQRVFDKLCKTNKEFLKEYNEILLNSPNAGKKYTGKEKLPISYISRVSIDYMNGPAKETVLYTDQKRKSEQVCPFFKLYSETKRR